MVGPTRIRRVTSTSTTTESSGDNTVNDSVGSAGWTMWFRIAFVIQRSDYQALQAHEIYHQVRSWFNEVVDGDYGNNIRHQLSLRARYPGEKLFTILAPESEAGLPPKEGKGSYWRFELAALEQRTHSLDEATAKRARLLLRKWSRWYADALLVGATRGPRAPPIPSSHPPRLHPQAPTPAQPASPPSAPQIERPAKRPRRPRAGRVSSPTPPPRPTTARGRHGAGRAPIPGSPSQQSPALDLEARRLDAAETLTLMKSGSGSWPPPSPTPLLPSYADTMVSR